MTRQMTYTPAQLRRKELNEIIQVCLKKMEANIQLDIEVGCASGTVSRIGSFTLIRPTEHPSNTLYWVSICYARKRSGTYRANTGVRKAFQRRLIRTIIEHLLEVPVASREDVMVFLDELELAGCQHVETLKASYSTTLKGRQ